jgi:hypothetical protein
MICHDYKCIFIHQRKCAGVSIIHAFGFEPSDPEWYSMNDGVLSPEYESAPSGYFQFSVVRNPWDRFISGWKYLPVTRETWKSTDTRIPHGPRNDCSCAESPGPGVSDGRSQAQPVC